MADTKNIGRIEDTNTYDGAVTALLKLDGSEILLFYRQSDEGHRDRSARVVMRRSPNSGEAWTEPTVVHNIEERDTGEPSVVYDSTSGRIVLFDHAMKLVKTTEHEHPVVRGTDAYRLESTDGGKTWSDPVRVTDDLIVDNPWPFGGYVETSRGLMTQFSSPSGIEVMFSSDGGQTWGGNKMVPEPVDGDRQPVEPVPCAVTEDKVLLFGRDNAKGDFFAMRSDDGGARHPARFGLIRQV